MGKQKIGGSVTSAVLVLVSLSAFGWVSYSMLPKNAAPATMTRPASIATNARPWLGVLGLDVDALAAAGVNAEAASVMLADLQEHLDEHGEDFVASIDAHNAVLKQADSDTRMIQAGKRPADNVVTANAAAYASALADRDARRTAAINAASTRLPEGAKALLAVIRSNAGREVPPAYLTVSRTDAEWVAVRDALIAERQAAERGESLSGEVASFLSNVRTGTTATALSNASTNTAAIRGVLH